jgi:hypothetical protein
MLFVLLTGLGVAQAQIALPPVQLPRLPPARLPVDVNKTLTDTVQAVDPQQLVDLRGERINRLLREHRDRVEADPHGAPMVRAEVVALSPSAEAVARAQAAGFVVARERTLAGLELSTVVFRAPRGLSTRQALQRLRALDPQGTYDFNHIYLESGDIGAAQGAAGDRPPDAPPAPATDVKVGLIDGGVDRTHPAFSGAPAQVSGCNGRPVPSEHGTAVASLLAGYTETFAGAAPRARLYAADVYCGAPTGGAVDAIAQAFAWLARERVGVINVSLVGPANAMLGRIVQSVIARGHIVVAAVGNDGPASPPLYPAAYPGVVGVTGVDGKRKVLLEALRGEQVDFAAPGADMVAANGAREFAAVRGTSFAAPIVAGLLAGELSAPDTVKAGWAVERLASRAEDLGERGVDVVYGYGFVVAGNGNGVSSN